MCVSVCGARGAIRLDPLTALCFFPKLKVLNIESAWLPSDDSTPKTVENLNELETLYIVVKFLLSFTHTLNTYTETIIISFLSQNNDDD
jgi:hypothetical protein